MYDFISPFALVFIARIKNADRFAKESIGAEFLKKIAQGVFLRCPKSLIARRLKFRTPMPRDFVNYVFSRVQSAASLNLSSVVPITEAAAV